MLVNDGTAPTSDGCQAISTPLANAIALIDRGTCDFTVKVKSAQNAGAIAVIVANTLSERLYELFGEGRKSVLFDYLVDGMNFTPPQPTYEEMRDGILASVIANPDDAGDECKVWSAFAEFGVGAGASGTGRGKGVTIVESFALPAACAP